MALLRNSKWVGQHRDKVDFSPKDVTKVNEFLKDESASNKVDSGGKGYCAGR